MKKRIYTEGGIMESSLHMFNNIKCQVNQLIKENLHREVTNKTKYNKISGIYMIYIDHFTSDKIIPIYRAIN